MILKGERIISIGKQRARDDLFEQQRRADEEAFNHQRQMEEAAKKQAAFMKDKPFLEEAARQQHMERFANLDAILGNFVAPLQHIRDRYYPDKAIVTTERYENVYGRRPNVYQKALMFLAGTSVDGILRALAVHAIALEEDRKRLLFAGPYKKPEYNLLVALHYDPFNSEGFRRELTERAQNPGVDLQLITPEEDLLEVRQEGTFFSSHHNTSPSVLSMRGNWIPYWKDAKAEFEATSDALADQVAEFERENLRLGILTT